MILGLIDETVQAGARVGEACKVIGLTIRTRQRWLDQEIGEDRRAGPLSSAANRMTDAERESIVETACSPEFRDVSPKQIVPTLLDRNVYIGSESTFYRVLRERNLLPHRGKAKKPSAPRPRPTSKVASGPCQLWSWDITYLPGPIRGTFFYLYMIVDSWSRKVVAYAIHDRETAEHASALIAAACEREGVEPGSVQLHSDNRSPMKGATMLATLERLGVAASFSRPSVSDDNPYSESLFRTAKYCSRAPKGRFITIEAAILWADEFVDWYNHKHRHSSIRFVTPADRHDGKHIAILLKRKDVMERAKARNPNRWSGETRCQDPIALVTLHPPAVEATEVTAA